MRVVDRAVACVAGRAFEPAASDDDDVDEIQLASPTDLVLVAHLHIIGFPVARWWLREWNANLVAASATPVHAAVLSLCAWYRAALAATVAQRGAQHIDVAACCTRLALLAHALGASDEARELQARALSIQEVRSLMH